MKITVAFPVVPEGITLTCNTEDYTNDVECFAAITTSILASYGLARAGEIARRVPHS